jgi:hypothetical protein
MTDRPKHGGNLSRKEQRAIAAALELDPDASNVERTIGDGRYVQADYDYGKFEAVVVISDLTDEGEAIVKELIGE